MDPELFEHWNQWLDLGVFGLAAASAFLIGFEAWASCRTLRCRNIFMRLSTIGCQMSVIDCRVK